MKVNKWTVGLAAVGLISLPAALQAEEQMSPVETALASTVISGYVNTAAQWNFGTGNGYMDTLDGDYYGLPRYSYNTPNKQDGFSLNAVKLSIEKPLDPNQQWSAGYQADLMVWSGCQLPGQHLGGRGQYVRLRDSASLRCIASAGWAWAGLQGGRF